jgi:hypothetical protein
MHCQKMLMEHLFRRPASNSLVRQLVVPNTTDLIRVLQLWISQQAFARMTMQRGKTLLVQTQLNQRIIIYIAAGKHLRLRLPLVLMLILTSQNLPLLVHLVSQGIGFVY